MSTDRLKIYNGALLLCGEKHLASLTERREPRYLLDQVWNDGGVRGCLEQAQWHFAMRTSQFDYNPSFVAEFGFQRAFTKPDDWVITSGVFEDGYCLTPLTQYADEKGYWFSDRDTIYVRYVSDAVTYGMDLAGWPVSFTDYVKAYFASRVIHKLSASEQKIVFLMGPQAKPDKGWLGRSLMIAKNKSAMVMPTTFPTRGTWAAARMNGRNSNRADGGSQTQLIG